MTTIPERVATPLELARESARMTPCACGARSGYSCDGQGGMHLARFAEARRFGLMPAERMVAVLGGLDVFTPMTLIPGGAR